MSRIEVSSILCYTSICFNCISIALGYPINKWLDDQLLYIIIIIMDGYAGAMSLKECTTL